MDQDAAREGNSSRLPTDLEAVSVIVDADGALVAAPSDVQEQFSRSAWPRDAVRQALLQGEDKITLAGEVFVCTRQFSFKVDRAREYSLLRLIRARESQPAIPFDRLFKTAFTGSPTAYFASQPGGRMLACNQAFAQLFGYPDVEEAMKIDTASLYPENRRAEYLRLLEQTGQLHNLELDLKRRDGQVFPALVSVFGHFSSDGHLVALQGSVLDLSEVRRLEEKLLHSQRMEALGTLAGSIAHDFNNLLTAIAGNVELSMESLSPASDLYSNLREVMQSCERAFSLTKQLVSFSRPGPVRRSEVNVDRAIGKLEKMLRRVVGETIHLRTDLQAAPHVIEIDPGQFDQILFNLVLNARDAMPSGGTISIATDRSLVEAGKASVQRQIPAGDYLRLTLSDDGSGMTDEVLENIFEPFFTTKPSGKGTGLGLPTIKNIVDQIGGVIKVSSKVGQGTTFEVYFPLADELIAVAENVSRNDSQTAPGATVLVVEDEPAVRNLVVRVLVRAGFQVLSAGSAKTAITIFQQHWDTVDLLVTDLVLPGMGGRQLAQVLQERSPRLKCLFVSGYTDDEMFRRSVLSREVPFLEKPFSSRALLDKVRELT